MLVDAPELPISWPHSPVSDTLFVVLIIQLQIPFAHISPPISALSDGSLYFEIPAHTTTALSILFLAESDSELKTIDNMSHSPANAESAKSSISMVKEQRVGEAATHISPKQSADSRSIADARRTTAQSASSETESVLVLTAIRHSANTASGSLSTKTSQDSLTAPDLETDNGSFFDEISRTDDDLLSGVGGVASGGLVETGVVDTPTNVNEINRLLKALGDAEQRRLEKHSVGDVSAIDAWLADSTDARMTRIGCAYGTPLPLKWK